MMRKLLTFLLGMAPLLAFGQTNVTIGAGALSGTASNGATGDPGPMYRSSASSNFVYSRHHYLYTSSELVNLPMGSVITHVAWYKTNNAATNSNMLFEIFLKNSSLTTVQSPSQTWANLTGSSTQVYSSNSASVSSAIGWVVFPLSTPFVYTGGGLEVSVNFDISQGTNPWTTAGFSWAKDNITGRTISYCGSTPSTTLNNARTVRPQFRITYVPGGPCTSPPTAGTVVVSDSLVCENEPVQLSLTGNSYGQGQTYQWQTSSSATGPFTNLGSSSTTPASQVNPTNHLYVRAQVTCGTSSTYTNAQLIQVNPAMPGGTYTIDHGAPTAGTNFNSFSDAIDALSCGISGNVVFEVASGTYTEQVVIPPILGASATRRVTFRSASGDPSDVTLRYANTSAENYVVSLNGASYVTLKDMTLQSTNATYERVLVIEGDASYDSVVGCVLTVPSTTSSSNLRAVIFANSVDGVGNVIMNNDVINGAYGMYLYGVTTGAEDWVVKGNRILNANNYSLYLRYLINPIITDNEITTGSTTTHYGFYSYYCDGKLDFSRNKVTMTGSGTKYAMYIYYNDGDPVDKGVISNNVILVGSGSSTANGIRNYYSTNLKIFNNTVRVNTSSTAGVGGYFYYTATYTGNEIFNNLFANMGGGYAVYLYSSSIMNSTNQYMDYNNLYSTGQNIVQQGSPSGTFPNLTAWRDASGLDLNSISHEPGFTSATNLQPDPTNPHSWSLNGRGIHEEGNDKDILGNPRVTQREDGVPDIGAYEFEPTVMPPVAEAIPAAPVAGTQQVFTFGEDTVARIEWPAVGSLPTAVTVRQYTGRIAPQFLAASPYSYTYMYSDIQLAGSYDPYNLDLYYKDPWLGTILSEPDMKMAKRYNAGDWTAFNFGMSSSEVTLNYINAETVKTDGEFTGVDNDTILSALITFESSYICPGDSTVLQANLGPGITYQWYRGGSPIPGATQDKLTVDVPASYSVRVYRGNSTQLSEPVMVDLVNPPDATLLVDGAPFFCPGHSLFLRTVPGNDLSYQWTMNGMDIAGATDSILEVNQTGYYSVTVTNLGCSRTSTDTLVQEEPLPMPEVVPSLTKTICEDSTLVLSLQVPPTPYSNLNFRWRKDAQEIPGAVGDQYTVTSAGNYSVVVASGTCPEVISNGTNVFTVPHPQPTIQQQGMLLTTGVYSEYQWFHNGDTLHGATNFGHTATQPGAYHVVVFDDQCPGQSPIVVIPSVHVGALSGEEAAIRVYPNPARTQVTIASDRDLTVSIYNMDGRRVLGPEKGKTLSVGHMPSGVYMMKFYDDQGRWIKAERLAIIKD